MDHRKCRATEHSEHLGGHSAHGDLVHLEEFGQPSGYLGLKGGEHLFYEADEGSKQRLFLEVTATVQLHISSYRA